VGIIEFHRLLDLLDESNNHQQEVPGRYQDNAGQ
jgi:hypothetical protein